MSRSWWLKGFVLLLLAGTAVLLAVPHLVPYDRLPEFIRRHFARTIRTEVGLQPGLRLVYEVDMEKAISLRLGAAAQGLEQILSNEHPGLSFRVERQRGTDLLISAPRLGPELSYRNLRRVSGGWLTESERDERAGTIRLRFDESKTAEVREQTLKTAMTTIDKQIDESSRDMVSLTREGDRIVLELPGMRGREAADRVKAIIHRTTDHPPSLKFAIVANDPDYIRKLAAAIPPDSGIEVVTELPSADVRLHPGRSSRE
jgi:preprotein translocase subunit SecD